METALQPTALDRCRQASDTPPFDLMTSLIAWVGADSRGPASLYLASDSRISWDSSASWDLGRKLFASAAQADVFGYCGDVLFPALALGQVMALADARLLRTGDAEARHREVSDVLERSLARFPANRRNAFTVLHGARQSEGMTAHFRLWRTDWTQHEGWAHSEVPVPSVSSLLAALGSGSDGVRNQDFKWSRSDAGRTSRAVFGAFCDALAANSDPRSGGPPQLVGIYRTGTARAIGTVQGGAAYLLGVPILDHRSLANIEWRNDLFERCDGESLQILDGAQPQPRPAGLG